MDGDDAYYADVLANLEPAYLAADDPRGQSGFSGDEAAWERARRVVTVPIDRDGDFLDIGCASGLLMETVHQWCREDGHAVEPHGLELSEDLARLARSRLAGWADRIHVGNVMTWDPPGRYQFVRTELVYVPEHRRRDLVVRLLEQYLSPGGRAIICSYGSSRRPDMVAEDMANRLESWGFTVGGAAQAADLNGVVVARVAWVDG